MPEEHRGQVDLLVKNFLRAILNSRKRAYDDGEIQESPKIGRDCDAGEGKHTWLYKSLIRKRKY